MCKFVEKSMHVFNATRRQQSFEKSKARTAFSRKPLTRVERVHKKKNLSPPRRVRRYQRAGSLARLRALLLSLNVRVVESFSLLSTGFEYQYTMGLLSRARLVFKGLTEIKYVLLTGGERLKSWLERRTVSNSSRSELKLVS